MSWTNNTGGGNGGPWGNKPDTPRNPRNMDNLDIEDIIKKIQDYLNKIMPGNNGNSLIIAFLAIVILVGWLYKSTYIIQADELGVELLFGKPKTEISEPGLHFHFWPVESLEKTSIRKRQENINKSGNQFGSSLGLMLSGDQNIVDVAFAVLWEVSDPKKFLFNIRNPELVVRQIADSAMREIVGRRPAQDIFRDDRAGIAEQVRTITQTTLDKYGSGIKINTVNIEDVAPPQDVADAFDEVQRAEQDEDRFVEEANQYSNRILGTARGEAAQIREDAAGYKNRVVQEADGEAQRFISVYEQYSKAPDVTRKRLYLETMERVLQNSSKIIIEQENGQGVIPYLPLPEIKKRDKQSLQQQPGDQ